jgi:glycine/D-amino acid oxidase-like deaminating enzyme
MVAVTEPTDALPADMPMSVFLDDGFHLRVRDGRVLLLRASPGRPDAPFAPDVDPAWVASVADEARRRVPPLAHVRSDLAAWGGSTK